MSDDSSNLQKHDDCITGQDLKHANAFIGSFRYAAEGVAAAWGERNFKVDCIFAVIAIILCVLLRVPLWGWAVVTVCIGVQLALETVNTAIEAVVDLASPQLQPLAKRAKDCAAGAALITACVSIAIACIVYIPALLNLCA